jgi:FixJ family two-component response regulator
MTVATNSATIGIHQPTAPTRDSTDSSDDCVRVGILPAGFACLVRGFCFLLNLQPWQLRCDQNPIARSRQRYVLFRRVSLLKFRGGKIVPTLKTRANDVRNIPTEPTTKRIRVALIEDEESVRQALSFQLRTAGFEVTPYSAAEDLLEVADAKVFDCVVADIYLPRMNGLQLQEELNRTIPHASIVFITGHGDLSLGMHAMRKGAVDFLEKPIDDHALLSSIARGANLSRQRRAQRLQLIELEELKHSLTSREREVFGLITSGLLNKQVAAELGTTERTVKAHRASVMNKMRADSIADLVRMAGVLQIHAG